MLSKKENLVRAINRDSPKWVPDGMEQTLRIYPPIIERPLSAGYDAFGCLWNFESGACGGSYPTPDHFVITDIGKWRKQIRIPDVDQFDWSKVEEQAAQIDRENILIEGWCEMGLFERSYLLFGMSGALMNYALEPELMEEVVSAIADYKIAFISKFNDIVKLDMVWCGDDWGMQTGLFMAPDIWRKIIKPHTRRLYDSIKERDIIINQHSCGKIEEIFADVVELGADIWNPCQPCNNLAMLKEQYKDRISFCGGLDSQFVLNREGVTAEEVRAEVRRRIDEMAEGGGYIAAPSHAVPYDPQILDAMHDEIKNYGRY